MKKTLTISIFLIVCLAFSAKAQKSYMSFFTGESSPLGDFSNINYLNNKAGFAKNGVVFGLDGAIYFHKNWAIAGTLSFQDQGELSAANVYSISYGYTSSFNDDNTTTTGVGRYQSLNLLIGPQYTFKIKEKWFFDVRAQAGILKSLSTPATTSGFYGAPKQTDSLYQKSSTAIAFGYSGGLSLRYEFSDGFGLALRGSYINSPGWNISTINREEEVGRLVTKQPVTLVQTTIGIYIKL